MDPKNNFLRDKFAGNPNANRPLSEAGREGAEVRRSVRYKGYENVYNAIIRMYPELAEAPTVTANVAATAVQATNSAPDALQYPLPVNTLASKMQNTDKKYAAASPAVNADKFDAPEASPADWVEQLAREAEEALRQNNGAEQ